MTHAVPDLLRGTLETMSFARRAGEWELDLGSTNAPLSALVATFAAAFGWATFRTFGSHDGSRVWPTGPQRPPLAVWLEATDADDFEATLDLALFWEVEELHESMLPESGGLWFERETAVLTLTIWPNLFTDRLPLYERQTSHSYAGRDVEWPRAARRNRERLAESLRSWETASDGELVAWGSELVDGVQRYGFGVDATSLRGPKDVQR